MSAKSVKEIEAQIKELEAKADLLHKKAIPALEKAIEGNKTDRGQRDIEIAETKFNFNARLKELTKQRNEAERMRRKFSRDLADAKKELQGIPGRVSYYENKIRRLKAAEPSKPVEKNPKRKAKDGEGIESLAGVI